MKYLFSLLFAISASLLTAQLTLEHTYTYSGSLMEVSEGEYKYYIMDVSGSQCRIFNEDHSLFKTISLAVPSGFYLSDIKFVSRNLFNSDDKIELLYIYSKTTSTYTSYGMKVVSEDGSELLSLDNGGYAEIKSGSDGPKLLAYQYVWSTSFYEVSTKVYTIGGSSKSTSAMMNYKAKIFPNPVEEILNIETGALQQFESVNATIIDSKGRQVLKKNIATIAGVEQINTRSLPKGNYILQLTEKNGTKHSTKLIKK